MRNLSKIRIGFYILEDDACTDQSDNDEVEDEQMNEDVLPSDSTVWLVQFNNDQCMYISMCIQSNVRVHIALYNVRKLCLCLHTAQNRTLCHKMNQTSWCSTVCCMVSLFSMFCFNCREGSSKAVMKQNCTMVTIIQRCIKCNGTFQWRSQPLVLG